MVYCMYTYNTSIFMYKSYIEPNDHENENDDNKNDKSEKSEIKDDLKSDGMFFTH